MKLNRSSEWSRYRLCSGYSFQIIGQDVDRTLQTMLSENLGEIYDALWLMQNL